ncbi:similar to Saccharomyces cerevisiae YBR138C Cytoplasmic protein of unknown function, potentially phosphorylated by Cdc28p [Maudiozyma barnettii]|uniref:Uncharacterized protein n=1 Tax=Maudiozyma barnettii TaxID=61262 RepID=A0A8H2VDD6_9SACH|nr:hypothetical protein [Kazachstania barnettii]CAB4253214.1 similar to Saccharomyces cerevisiae YBR138C Cytoplasmic protein of unknown function, potentially phosphorylated by Cdc28p [Kazachstania barnettii]CAD1780250.1 similar to Saccharomyces cerevisiae YBR138C Cytoplasmic protein of unknown function, potentially phosphorylated by Cdc28p [Kazachstania barnettii]
MDEQTRLRVFEPLDTNSLSIISSASSTNLSGLKSNANSFMNHRGNKTPTTPSLPHNDENGNGMLQWKLEKKDFVFNSNSTPSKKRHNFSGSSSSRPELLQVKKRKSQLIGAKRRMQSKLAQSTSKLDLLEVDKITTLPLVPPPQNRSEYSLSSSSNSGNSVESNILCHYQPNECVKPNLRIQKSKLNLVEEIRIHNKNGNRYISYGTPNPLMITQDGIDEGEEEEGQPIVMIEDYIPYNELSKNGAKKRVSMSDLRSKMNKRNDSHIPLKFKKGNSKLPNVPEDSNNNNRKRMCNMVNELLNPEDHHSVSEYGDKYISDLGIGTPQLRKCVICERPLYELVNTLSHHEQFKEIVCENCTYAYEHASKLFENCEFETSGESHNSSSFMSDLESSLDNVVMTTTSVGNSNQVSGQDGRQTFSPELINLLKLQVSQSERNRYYQTPQTENIKPSLAWFLEARDKLHLQWQTNGLVPFFMRRIEQ